jgi:hypothetical protein
LGVERITLNDRQVGVFCFDQPWIASDCLHFVSTLQRLAENLTARQARCTPEDYLHLVAPFLKIFHVFFFQFNFYNLCLELKTSKGWLTIWSLARGSERPVH